MKKGRPPRCLGLLFTLFRRVAPAVAAGIARSTPAGAVILFLFEDLRSRRNTDAHPDMFDGMSGLQEIGPTDARATDSRWREHWPGSQQ